MKISWVRTALTSLIMLVAVASPAQAKESEPLAAETTVTGAPALIIILVVLALIVIGAVAVFRFVRRKAKGE